MSKLFLFKLVNIHILIQLTISCPKIIQLQQWGGKEMQIKNFLVSPAFYMIIHQSSGDSCNDTTSCSIQMKNIENFHVHSHGWRGIGYNFCIGQDGAVYEGRGWNVQSEGIMGYNTHSLSICFIGTFDKTIPNFRSFLAAQELITCGINKRFISPSYSLIAHRQISTSNPHCPGDALFNEIQRNERFMLKPRIIR